MVLREFGMVRLRISSNIRAASAAEFATFGSLGFTLLLVLWIGLNDRGEGFNGQSQRTQDLLSDTMIENCLIRTRANDTVLPRQAGPFNCFRLENGNDRIVIDSGDNIIYPGDGNDTVTVLAGTRDTQIVYQSGNDTYHAAGGRTLVDLRSFERGAVRLQIDRGTPATAFPGDVFDPMDTGSRDLHIRTRKGTMTIAGHFANTPVDTILFGDAQLSGDEIVFAALQDQSTDRNDRILGTEMSDVVSPKGGNDSVSTFGGDDIISYTSGYDTYDPGPGADILDMGEITSNSVQFSIEVNHKDIRIDTGDRGSIILKDQATHPISGTTQQFTSVHFADDILRSDRVMTRAIEDQSKTGVEDFRGTSFSDVIRPGSGTKRIYPGTGSDHIFIQGGRITIYPSENEIGDRDVLDLSNFSRADLAFVTGANGDLVIKMNDQETVTIAGQLSRSPGDGTNIEIFQMKNEILPDDVMRQLFFNWKNGESLATKVPGLP